MTNKIYLDFSAATPLCKEALAAMQPFFSQEFYNPSAVYLAAKNAKRHLDEARHSVAQNLGSKPGEIIFTAGATEANNLAVQGIARQYPGAEILTSAIEHQSVHAPAQLYAHKEIPVDEDGIILLNKLSNLINDKTVLLSVMLVNNELGTIQPLAEIALLIKTIRQERLAQNNKLPLYLHTDAAQAGNFLELKVSRLGVDMMSINGGKIYGPKQAGVLYIKSGVKLMPLIVGGGQEFGLRSGTENLAASVGLAKALEIAQSQRPQESERLAQLRTYFESQIAVRLPNAHINGSAKHRAPHITSITLAGKDNERLLMELDELGIQCAAGSACSASSDEPSHVLKAIGLSQDLARSTLRFSFGRGTTKAQLETTVNSLISLI